MPDDFETNIAGFFILIVIESLVSPKEIYRGSTKSILTTKFFSVHSLISREYLIFESVAFYSNSKSTTSLVTSISERIIPSSNLLYDPDCFILGTTIGSLNFISINPSLDISLIRGMGLGGSISFGLKIFAINFGTKASNTAF